MITAANKLSKEIKKQKEKMFLEKIDIERKFERGTIPKPQAIWYRSSEHFP
jgi:hypothetical protein